MSNRRDARELEELPWRKSSYSGSGGGNCVEVAGAESTTYVRDTKAPKGPTLAITSAAWLAFVAHVDAPGRPH